MNLLMRNIRTLNKSAAEKFLQKNNPNAKPAAATRFDKEGNALSGDKLKNFKGPTYSSQEEAAQALDRRYSYAVQDTEGNRAGLMGNKKRANIFGN